MTVALCILVSSLAMYENKSDSPPSSALQFCVDLLIRSAYNDGDMRKDHTNSPIGMAPARSSGPKDQMIHKALTARRSHWSRPINSPASSQGP